MGSDLAIPPGTDAARLTRDLGAAHDRFVSTGAADPTMRPLVVESWRRSLAGGMDPEHGLAPIRLTDDLLGGVRESHPLTGVMPVIRRLLVESAADSGLLVAVSDAAGQLLYVEGAPALRSRAEGMHFMPGADWSEASAGTNAPGTALALDRPVQLLGPEHLSRQVTPWSCSAAPIHDPETGAVLGVLDVTGGPEVATPQALALVRATVAAVESELRIARLLRGTATPVRTPSRPAPRLEVLGRSAAALRHHTSAVRLPLRGSELLLVLAHAPDGMSAAELAVALSDDEQASVTIRVEVSRIRTLVSPLQLASRPYRLTSRVDTDIDVVRAAMRTGRLRQAVAAYAGPVLPHSVAPAVVALRDDLHGELRSGLMAGADPDALLAFAETPHGRADYDLWVRARDLLPTGSSRRIRAEGHLIRLDAELGAGATSA